MPKQQTSQRYILKLHSSRLRRAKWNLTVPLSDARKNDEVISLCDSQILRWINEINNTECADENAIQIKRAIRFLKREPNSLENRRRIRRLYKELDEVEFKRDYMCLVIDRVSDYKRACKGFTVNGIRYVRLLGTNGGVKESTIVFVSERVADTLRKRIDNGRDLTKKMIPAKLEAYRALTCSGSIPVSMPNGILVVNDCVTEFSEDIIYLTDENTDEPEMTFKANEPMQLDESDGYGIMLPSLAQRWSEELNLGYVTGGVNTRFSWEKGMVFSFDFLEFADTVAHSRIVKDAWGHEVDLSNVELILTTSMLKLWDSYESIDHYLRCCSENHYAFGISKVCPQTLESERDLNYQFIQSYDLNDDDIDELIYPTIRRLHDVLEDDYQKTLIFLRGVGVTSSNVMKGKNDFTKALMVEPAIYQDPFIRKKVFRMIKKRIDDAKIGVVTVHGNYSIASGDPYALCQSMFGLPVTGLLRKGEIYNNFWVQENVGTVACFRAPMTCHNNIRLMRVASREDVLYWFRYMTACTAFNAWDSSAQALNGMDKDGDLVLTTDDDVLVRKCREEPSIICVQRKAEKVNVTEDALIQSNIDSFGDDIGKITNRITSMFDVQAGFPRDSEEYRILDYRIKCGQMLQQNAIDKAKGIICKPMPKDWYDRASNEPSDGTPPDEADRLEMNMRILADKKPYFMIYIYPDLMKRYKTYITNTGKKCTREFRKTIDALVAADSGDLSEQESVFIDFYHKKMPVGTNDCVMNKICRRFEAEFDHTVFHEVDGVEFDSSILKSGHEYARYQYQAIAALYKEYVAKAQEFKRRVARERIDDDEAIAMRYVMLRDFKSGCLSVCSNASVLCDIIVDLCYAASGTKQFVWDICGDEIVDNLLERNGWMVNFPVKDDDGDIEYGGMRFRVETVEVEHDEHCVE